MSREALLRRLEADLEALRGKGEYKEIRWVESPMDARVRVDGRDGVLVLCSNNYLGLASHPEVVRAGTRAMEEYGAGTASVRFICGSFAIHRRLEERLARFLGAEAALAYASCWNANEGLIPALAGEGDAVLSDELNHASIIDACRLAKGAERLIFRHGDMEDLEAKLRQAQAKRSRLIVTDGVFSMEGDLANLPAICDLAKRYDAVVVVDDSHGTGVLGETGRGTAEHFGLIDRVDIVTGTLGKALGGAAGGFVAGPRAVIDYLMQRSRPQLFSNPPSPAVAGSALAALEILEREPERVRRLRENARYFRAGLRSLGYRVVESESAIVPIIVGETAAALRLSRRLFDLGVFVVGVGYPVVPEGAARLRAQISAAHSRADLDRALEAFARVKEEIEQRSGRAAPGF